jgi:uncharacterized protein
MHESLNIVGPAGKLQAMLQYEPEQAILAVAVMCHPNPQQEGTMKNKVVTTMAKVMNNLGMPCVTFNFRGVGDSEGEFGEIQGEIEDCLAVVEWVKNKWPEAQLWLAGFSFGSYIAAKTASLVRPAQLISIAPPVHLYDWDNIEIDCPWLILHGDADEVVPAEQVYDWYEQLNANKHLIRFPETGHFFHRRLMDLQQQLEVHFKEVEV